MERYTEIGCVRGVSLVPNFQILYDDENNKINLFVVLDGHGNQMVSPTNRELVELYKLASCLSGNTFYYVIQDQKVEIDVMIDADDEAYAIFYFENKKYRYMLHIQELVTLLRSALFYLYDAEHNLPDYDE